MRRGHAADTPPHVIGFVEGAAVTSAPANDDPRSGEPRDRPPRILAGRYELGAAVGGGGSAQVHRAWDRKLQRPVAVKLFAPGVSGPDRVRRGQELQTLARLTHPGLVELHDAGRDADRDFLVMQLVEGPSLADLVTRGPLPVPMVVGLGAALAEALAYVHAAGVTHRDLKPDNVLLDEQGRPLLADFGIALLVDGTRVTVAGDVVGTAAYLAPEQVRGAPVGPAADVYALGLVLLEALRGEREFPGTTHETVFARLHRAPRVPDDLPGELPALLRAMTAAEPAARPTAAALAAALRSAGAALDPGTRPVAGPGDPVPDPASGGAQPFPAGTAGGFPPAPMPTGAPSRRRLAVAAGVVGLAAAAGVGVAALTTGGDPGLAGASVSPQDAATGPVAASIAPPPGAVGSAAIDRAGDTAPTPELARAGSGGSPGAAGRPAGASAGVAGTPTSEAAAARDASPDGPATSGAPADTAGDTAGGTAGDDDGGGTTAPSGDPSGDTSDASPGGSGTPAESTPTESTSTESTPTESTPTGDTGGAAADDEPAPAPAEESEG